MDLVLVESPYAGDVEVNVNYAKRCVKDCLDRGEAPYASHLYITQEGILDDLIPDERKLGIDAGLAWGAAAKRTVVYIDRGISRSMEYGIRNASRVGRDIVVRRLFDGEVTEADRKLVASFQTENWPGSDERNSTESVVEEITQEVRFAESKFARFNSRHEAYGVLLEEVDELWDDIKANNYAKARKEAVQVAAMAFRYLRDF
jgi:hypothetical protein